MLKANLLVNLANAYHNLLCFCLFTLGGFISSGFCDFCFGFINT
jgi:hypothetical protein